MSKAHAQKELEDAVRHNLDMDLFDEMRNVFHGGRTKELIKRFCHKCGGKETLAVHITLTAKKADSCTATVGLQCEACGWKQDWFGYYDAFLSTGGVSATPPPGRS